MAKFLAALALVSVMHAGAQDLFLTATNHAAKAQNQVPPQVAVHAFLVEGFPNFPCTEAGANELLVKYQAARVDTIDGPTEIEQLLMDDAEYTIPILGTYKGKQAVVNDYLKHNKAIRGDNYKNDKIVPATITKEGEAAQGQMTFDAWKLWWHNGLTATISLECVDKRWMIESIRVA
jgi:hypothetical protein